MPPGSGDRNGCRPWRFVDHERIDAGHARLLRCRGCGTTLDPKQSRRKVVGIDIDIRPHNRAGIEGHPLSHKITLLQGSSVAPEIVDEVKALAKGYDRIMLFLDSNHTHEHVLAELEAYAPLTTKGSYCVVWDTGVEDLPDEMCSNRPWARATIRRLPSGNI